MPKEIIYDRNLYKKNIKHKEKLSFIFIFMIILLFLCLILNISDIFSGIITKEGSLFKKQKIEVSSFTVYGVSIVDFLEEDSALDYSKQVSLKGGSGYVYQNGEYFVLTSVYPSLIEAQEVCDNLKEFNYTPKIVYINIEEISKIYKGKNIDDINFCINVFREIYLELYNLSIFYDKQEEVNTIKINTEIAKCLNKVLECKMKLESKSEIDKICLSVLEGINNEKNILENLLNFEDKENSLEFSSLIKNTYVKTILLNKELILSINQM